ncbi:hypothetical protein GCM10010116_53840 [Microbispora rosea subsp. aerata]|nr:ATP-binding protein [Microbispora rosea]GGO26816.1 hypothetical protein GCM10010116_53840 [Microbispora rosea subsp. aerata]GIH58421.1 hypothetical protein Mro02_53350 [Microbispora rosea subsp. aerata]GLJ84006.1 hypothetical protein GCM10017588_27340 [Microbispora rosea subsp. aerata]
MDGRTAGPVVPGAPTPLVGRRDALAALRGATAASRRDGFQFVALVGDPGMGKTRLLGELTAMAGRDGFTPLWGRAAEYEQILPYSALVDALDDHLDTHREEVIGAVGAGHAALLSGVFPGLAADGAPARDEPALADDRSGLPATGSTGPYGTCWARSPGPPACCWSWTTSTGPTTARWSSWSTSCATRPPARC